MIYFHSGISIINVYSSSWSCIDHYCILTTDQHVSPDSALHLQSPGCFSHSLFFVSTPHGFYCCGSLLLLSTHPQVQQWVIYINLNSSSSRPRSHINEGSCWTERESISQRVSGDMKAQVFKMSDYWTWTCQVARNTSDKWWCLVLAECVYIKFAKFVFTVSFTLGNWTQKSLTVGFNWRP